MTDKTPEEQAGIEAAEAWDITYPTTSAGHTDSVIALQNALATLRASRTPKGVKPETVEPGTLFRFADVGDVEQPVHKMIFDGDNPERRMFISADGDNCALGFWEGALVIPIQEEEGGECEHGEDYSNVIDRHHCSKCGNVL